MSYSTPRSITADDNFTDFDCGEPSLDSWLRERALANQSSGASHCYVTCSDGRVVGYYTLSTGSVVRAGAPKMVRLNMPDPIPVILIGRLGVDVKEQGKNLGAHLVRDAITRTVHAADAIGIAALLVHTQTETARSFWEHHEFIRSPTDEMHLMLPIRTARVLVHGGI